MFPIIGFSQVTELQKLSDKAETQLYGTQKKRIPFDPIGYVNPFIGTGGHGHTFPGAVVPFGMAQVSPDTRPEGWDGCSGYHYSDSVIYGFANTHLSGTGIPDYSDILIVPQIGKKANLVPGYVKKGGYGSGFSHDDEVATPGFYSVKLQNGIQAKLTATEHCGIHQYDFPKKKGKRFIVIDLGYRDRVIETEAVKESNTRITGKRISEAWAKEQHLYFDLETSIPFSKAKWYFNKEKGQYQMVLEFPASVIQVTVRVGLSGTDVQGATTNLKREISSFDFNQYQVIASASWRRELSKVELSQENKANLINFYTALYHAFTHPSIWSDVDGRYRTFNNTISHSETPVYSVFSLWDTYRAANPLYTLLQSERAHDFIESYRLQAEQTGVLPMWTLSNNETDCMIGYHAVSIITDAYAKGIKLEKPDSLLADMVRTAKSDRYGRVQYGKNGFISAETEAESVSKTLEYAYDDWCIAEFAKMLGNKEIEDEFRLRSASYMNVWNENSGFFQPRNGGLWLPNFVPNEVNHHYTEANAWQYSMAPQHNIAEMRILHGGNKGLEAFLDRMFNDKSGMSGREQADITGLIGQYAHGNEPSHHMAYAYNYAGVPYKTQELVRSIMKNEYRAAPDGLSGNEDCGQMSAWFVLSSLGIYPYCPGSPTYTIGSPLFNYATVQLKNGYLSIQAPNNNESNVYVEKVMYNNEPMTNFFVTQDMLVDGGELTFTMSDIPNEKLADLTTDNNALPPANFVSVPYFKAENLVFDESLKIEIDKLSVQKGTIYVSVNKGDFVPYTQPINITQSTNLRAKVVLSKADGGFESPVVENNFIQYTSIGKIQSISEYENHYSGAGVQNLLDGRTGADEYRGTEWQGFNNKDVDIVVELKEKQSVSGITLGCLQDTKSWIMVPKAIEVEYSLDGITYMKLGRVTSNVSPKEPKGRFELIVDCVPTEAKYLKIRALNFGELPAWHISSGNPTWMFLDEVKIK
jgi:predicted alpha-1,2-mannosidase